MSLTIYSPLFSTIQILSKSSSFPTQWRQTTYCKSPFSNKASLKLSHHLTKVKEMYDENQGHMFSDESENSLKKRRRDVSKEKKQQN